MTEAANGNALLPCPFCGSTDLEPVDDASDTHALENAWIYCTDCLAEGPHAVIGCRDENDGDEIDLPKEAIEGWNKRAVPPRPPTARELACSGSYASNDEIRAWWSSRRIGEDDPLCPRCGGDVDLVSMHERDSTNDVWSCTKCHWHFNDSDREKST